MAPQQLTCAAIAEAQARMKATPVAANHMIRRVRSLLVWAEDNRLVTFKDGNLRTGTHHRPHIGAPTSPHVGTARSK